MPSEVIAHRSYDPDTRTLFITFISGELYAYDGVEPETWNALQRAVSKGRFFQKHIRDRYAYGKVEDPSAVRIKKPTPDTPDGGRAWPPRAGAGR